MSKQTSHPTQELCNRITCEFLEMPGLVLTLPQATHLWHVDSELCARALERLVARGVLRHASGTYRRDTSGYRAA